MLKVIKTNLRACLPYRPPNRDQATQMIVQMWANHHYAHHLISPCDGHLQLPDVALSALSSLSCSAGDWLLTKWINETSVDPSWRIILLGQSSYSLGCRHRTRGHAAGRSNGGEEQTQAIQAGRITISSSLLGTIKQRPSLDRKFDN